MLVTIYNSKRDYYGNCYWAYEFSDLGKIISKGKIAADNFPTLELRAMGIEYTHTELPIREFNKLTKNWEYHGCHWEDFKKHMGLL